MLRIDHVVLAVRDLDVAADRFAQEHGLVAVAGGSHPQWGTGNRIVPLGDRQYVELIAVVDPARAATTDLGRTIAGLADEGDRWFAWCLADDDLEATAARLGLDVVPGSRTRLDGSVVSWRGAGIDDARRTADLPFFIAWDVADALHPGATRVDHPSRASEIAWVRIGGDPAALASWTAHAALPVRIEPGPAGVRAVGLTTPAGDLVIG